VKKLVLAVLAVLAILLTPGCSDAPPNQVFSPADVPGRTIGALGGTPSESLARELGQAQTFATGEEMMAHLRAGTIDCAVMESTIAAEQVANSSGVRILSESLIEYDLRFAVAKENAELLLAVNSALDVLRQNGTLSSFIGKYFAGRSYTYTSPEGVETHPGELSLAVPPDSPPFTFKNADGELSGLDIEVARAVCDYLGVELRVIEYDVWELVNAVWYGMADLALGWLPGEGEETINVSEPYAHAVHVVIVRK